MRTGRRLPALHFSVSAAALAVGLAGATALGSPVPDESRRAEARALAEQGDAQFDAGRCDRAIPLWKRAEAAFHAPTILLRVARCQSLLGRVVEATAALEEVAGETPGADTPASFAAARDEARRDLPRVRARIATLGVNVRLPGRPVPAWIDIDGARMPEGRASFPVDPGTHLVRVRAEGAAWERSVHLEDGESRSVDVTLWAEPPVPGSRAQRRAGLAIGAGGVVSIGVGIGFALSALATSRGLDAVCGANRATCPPGEQEAIGRVKAYAVLADVTLGGGAALAFTGAVLLASEPRPRGEPMRVRFAVGPLSVAVAGEL